MSLGLSQRLSLGLRLGRLALTLLPTAAERGVIYVAGHGFYAGNPEVNHMRLNFSFPSDDAIRKGIPILGSVLEETELQRPLEVPAPRA